MIEIVHSLEDIKEEEWNTLVGKDKVETMYKWLLFAENAPDEKRVTYCNVLYKDHKKIKGILPAYYIETRLRDLATACGLLTLKKYLPKMKIPFTITQARIPYSVDSRYFGDPTHFYDCLNALETFSKENNHSFLVLKDVNQKMDLPGYTYMEVLPAVYTTPYPSWDSYITTQKKGKDIRYEYRKSVSHGTTTYLQKDLDGYYDVIHDLFLNVCEEHKSTIVYSKKYFERVEEFLSEYTKCLFAENNGEIVGYLYLLENQYAITCKFAGRDYTTQDPYVYFRLLYDLIKYSIKQKKPIYIEKATYEAKLRRGFKLKNKYCYMKPYHPLGDMYLTLIKRGNKQIMKKIEKIKSFDKN
ncbi:MAG: peptidogalycan biosysnthesis protein [Candidatus Methanofastidiosia archaeon]|jgi:predicted N-acyltransferase